MKILFIVISLTFQDQPSNICHRNLYLGSPVNTIHKAYEYISHLLQVSNTESLAHFIGSGQTSNRMTGETHNDYLFRLDEDGTRLSMPKALIMRVTVSASGSTFVDDLILMEGPNGLGDVNDKLNWFLANRYALSDYRNKFFNTYAFKDCDLIKESFTYFYDMFGDRFKKSLNQFILKEFLRLFLIRLSTESQEMMELYLYLKLRLSLGKKSLNFPIIIFSPLRCFLRASSTFKGFLFSSL